MVLGYVLRELAGDLVWELRGYMGQGRAGGAMGGGGRHEGNGRGRGREVIER